MDNSLAVQTAPAEIEKIKSTQLELNPTTLLDRENLQFFANMIEAADLIPKEKVGGQLLPLQVRKSRVMAKICAGVPHGFDPISAQQNLDIIDGKIGLNARGIEVKLSRTNHSIRIEYLNDTGCKLSVVKRTDDGKLIVIGHVEFNEDMAKKAGLIGKPGDMYKKWAPDMYFARCMTRVGKRLVPETMDTATVAYNLAKREEPLPESPAPAQIETSKPETVEENPVGDEYADQEYSGIAEAEAEFVEAEDAAEEPEEEISPLERLRADVIAKLDEMPERDRKNVLAGKTPPSKADETELRALLAEMEK